MGLAGNGRGDLSNRTKVVGVGVEYGAQTEIRIKRNKRKGETYAQEVYSCTSDIRFRLAHDRGLGMRWRWI